MKSDYDPELVVLFERAEPRDDCAAFTHGVMSRIDRARRGMLVFWSSMGIAAVIMLAVLAAPLLSAVSMATQLLPVSLVDIEAEWLRLLLAPINSVAAAIALGVLGLVRFWRRLF